MSNGDIARKMGKRRAEEIQKVISTSDFTSCPVGPYLKDVLSFLVDGMMILVERQSTQKKRFNFSIGPFSGQLSTSVLGMSAMFFTYLIGKGRGWW